MYPFQIMTSSIWLINDLLTVCMCTLYAARNTCTRLLQTQSGKSAGPIAVQLCLWVQSAAKWVVRGVDVLIY